MHTQGTHTHTHTRAHTHTHRAHTLQHQNHAVHVLPKQTSIKAQELGHNLGGACDHNRTHHGLSIPILASKQLNSVLKACWAPHACLRYAAQGEH